MPSPENVYSLNGTFTPDRGWGGSLGIDLRLVDSLGLRQTVKLPSYTVCAPRPFLRNGDFHAAHQRQQSADEKYYSPQFLFWDSFVSPSVGRTTEMTFSYEW